jgi:hypothetical protein
MQNTQQLKNEISIVVDLLPQEGVKLLAEFIVFLRTKFNLRPVAITESSDDPIEIILKI